MQEKRGRKSAHIGNARVIVLLLTEVNPTLLQPIKRKKENQIRSEH